MPGTAAPPAMAAAATAPAAAGPAVTPVAARMRPGERVQLGRMMGNGRVRMVMISENGGTIDVIYDESDPRQRTMSARALRLENRNGMLEVVYDTAAPTMDVTTRGNVRRVENAGGGMIEIVYDDR